MEWSVERALRQGFAAHNAGNLEEAERLYRTVLQAQPGHPEANHSLGLIAVSVNNNEVALSLFKRALETNPKIEQFWFSYFNTLVKERDFSGAKRALKKGRKKGLSKDSLDKLALELRLALKKNREKNTPSDYDSKNLMKLFQAGHYDDAEELAKSAIQHSPDDASAWKMLSMLLKRKDRKSEALAAIQKAVEINSDDAESHFNLGNTLRDLGRFKEAEVSYTRATELKVDFDSAFFNLSEILRQKGDFARSIKYAEGGLRINPHLSQGHLNLGLSYFATGDLDSALTSFSDAKRIDPHNKTLTFVLEQLERNKISPANRAPSDALSEANSKGELAAIPFLSSRAVEPELVESLYKLDAIELDRSQDPRHGNGRCSPDYNFFENEDPVVNVVSDDLVKLMKQAVKSDIFVVDSFFNIYQTGGGITPHTHLTELDEDKYLNIKKRKYSLIYYLDVGDQNCNDPGFLMLHEPDEEILPVRGMVVIFPADRQHSAFYGGKADRVLIGANFYALE